MKTLAKKQKEMARVTPDLAVIRMGPVDVETPDLEADQTGVDVAAAAAVATVVAPKDLPSNAIKANLKNTLKSTLVELNEQQILMI